MVLEQAVLRVSPDQVTAFEHALGIARPLIAASPGFHGIEVRRNLEQPGHYLLLVRWDDIASHRAGFRTSARYQEWRALLHPFYDPVPDIHYFGDPL